MPVNMVAEWHRLDAKSWALNAGIGFRGAVSR
jgi:hypothetical protein